MSIDGTPASVPSPHPEPLPPGEHDKAVKQAEKQERNRRDPREAPEEKLPQAHRDE